MEEDEELIEENIVRYDGGDEEEENIIHHDEDDDEDDDEDVDYGPTPRPPPNEQDIITMAVNQMPLSEVNMLFNELRNNYPQLVDRYLPSLSNLDNAFSALSVIERDIMSSQEEKDALRRYVGTHETPSTFNYIWCDECESMVGYSSHTHCPGCIYPSINKEHDTIEGKQLYHISPCGMCVECCMQKGHKFCACGNHMDTSNVCKHCSKCNKCCSCVICKHKGCSELVDCTDCPNCFDHCSCVFPTTNGPYGKTFPAYKRSERKRFNCERLAGIEWEFNRINHPRYLTRWTKKWLSMLHEDMSCGQEAVSAPCAGDYLIKCVSELGDMLKRARASIDNRCSIHVHVDARDAKWTDTYRFLKLYTLLEPILYVIAGQDRLLNRYCMPCGKDYAQALERIDKKNAVLAVAFTPISRDGKKGQIDLTPGSGRVSQKEKPGKRADNHFNCRRKGLNILPWLAGRGPLPKVSKSITAKNGDTIFSLAKQAGVSVSSFAKFNGIKPNTKIVIGNKYVFYKRSIAPDTTYEFRIHPNTDNAERVINWTKILVRLVDWSIKHSDKDMETLPKSPLRILCDIIAPECKQWILSEIKKWRRGTSISSGMDRMVSIKDGKYVY